MPFTSCHSVKTSCHVQTLGSLQIVRPLLSMLLVKSHSVGLNNLSYVLLAVDELNLSHPDWESGSGQKLSLYLKVNALFPQAIEAESVNPTLFLLTIAILHGLPGESHRCGVVGSLPSIELHPRRYCLGLWVGVRWQAMFKCRLTSSHHPMQSLRAYARRIQSISKNVPLH